MHAVRVVGRGDSLLEPGISRRLIERFVARAPLSEAPWVSRLTDREKDVLRRLVRRDTRL